MVDHFLEMRYLCKYHNKEIVVNIDLISLYSKNIIWKGEFC